MNSSRRVIGSMLAFVLLACIVVLVVTGERQPHLLTSAPAVNVDGGSVNPKWRPTDKQQESPGLDRLEVLPGTQGEASLHLVVSDRDEQTGPKTLRVIAESVLPDQCRQVEEDLSLGSGHGECVVLLTPGLAYRLFLRSPGALYEHPEKVTLRPGERRRLEVELSMPCRLVGGLTGVPGPRAGYVIQAYLSDAVAEAGKRRTGGWMRTVTGENGRFEFRIHDAAPSIGDLDLSLEFGEVALVRSARFECGTLVEVHPEIELCAVALVNDGLQVLPRTYKVEVIGSRPFVGWRPVNGVELLPKAVLGGAERAIFTPSDGGLYGFDIDQAIAIDGDVLGFRWAGPSEGGSGGIRITFQGATSSRVDVLPEVMVSLGDTGGSMREVKANQRRTNDAIEISGLSPATYDVYWRWNKSFRRLIARGVTVLSDQVSVVETEAAEERLVTGSFGEWDRLPAEWRPSMIMMGGAPTYVAPDGTFRCKALVPLPSDVEVYIRGIVFPARAAYDESRSHVEVLFDGTLVHAVDVCVELTMGGVLRGFFGSESQLARFTADGMPYPLAASFGSDAPGILRIPVPEEGRLSGVVYELRAGDWASKRLRGWIPTLSQASQLRLSLPGRLVRIVPSTGWLAGIVRLFATCQSGDQVSPRLYLGEYPFLAGAEELWLPSQAVEIIATDAYQGDLSRRTIRSTDTGIQF